MNHSSYSGLRTLIFALLALFAYAVIGHGGSVDPVALASPDGATPTPAPVRLTSTVPAATPTAAHRLPSPVWEVGGQIQAVQNEKAIIESASPQAPAGNQVILTEGFEGSFPYSGWTMFDGSNDGKERVWDDVNARPYSGAWSAWPAAGGADGVLPSGNQYPNNLDAWMIYGPFDLSNARSAQATFQLWRQLQANDVVFFGVAADGSLFDGTYWADTGDWEQINFDLGAYLGDDTVWVGWYFHSDASGRDVGAFVDDILITKDVQPCVRVAGSYNCTIKAITGWDQTLLTLQQGDPFTVVYNSGTWTMDYRNYAYVGPAGYSPAEDSQFWQGCKVDPASTYARLLGQIGNGSLLSIGDGGTFTANANGALTLRINDADGCLGDNDGAITLTLQKNIDLAVTKLEAASQPICAGASFDFSASIRNNGSAHSGFFNIRWDVDGQPLYGGHNSIAPGATDTHQHYWENISLGQHTLSFLADDDDLIAETNETNNQQTLNFTAIDCSTPPTVQFGASTYPVSENGQASGLQEVTLSVVSSRIVTVQFTTSNGTGTAGSDYTANSETLTFNPGETRKSFTIQILQDNLDEPDETINLALSSPTNATLGTPANTTLIIVDDDVTPCYTLITTVNPSGAGGVTVTPPSNCAGNQYMQGTVVVLSANPAAGFAFNGWSGAVSSTANPFNITLDGNKQITANFNATPVNRAPVANNQNVTTAQNTAMNITLSATDPDNDALTYQLVSNPTHGTFGGAPPTLTYMPASGFSGADSFTFKATDSKADSNVATVNITVNPPPTPCFTLTTGVSPGNGGVISVTPAPNCQTNQYRQGTVVSLSATLNAGFVFSGWSGEASGNTNPLTLTLDGNKSITANFNVANPPRLSVTGKTATQGAQVVVPIVYQATGNPISSLLFSVNFDETRLSFDPNLPNAVQFNPALPASYVKQLVAFDATDTDGELDLVVADFAQSPQPLPDGELLKITFVVKTISPAGDSALIQLTQSSFGGPSGEVAGTVTDGAISIQPKLYSAFLPMVRK